MWDEVEGDLFQPNDVLGALKELENNTPEEIRRQRTSERVDLNVPITVRPGNVSQRDEFAVEGTTVDVSAGGCMLLANRPILPGDVFWLEFDAEQVDLGPLHARCLRCRFVEENAFEVGFRFFDRVDLEGALARQSAVAQPK